MSEVKEEISAVKNLTNEEIDCLVYKIEQFSGNLQTPLIQHYTVDFLMAIIDKQKVAEIENQFQKYPLKGVDIIDFIKIIINTIEHRHQETLYLVLALIDLFKQISETKYLNPFITYFDFTDFICNYFVTKNITTYHLPTVKMPEQKKFNQKKQIRDIDIHPPLIYGKTDDNIRRLLPGSIITDSTKHNNAMISYGTYAQEQQRIITLDSLDTHLKFYKLNNKLERSVKPQNQKDKEVIIIGFSYSEREQRIGATLKDVSLIFWESSDSFKFQKCFVISALVPDYQTNIWYLDSLQMWVTTDKSNQINIWDLENENLKKQLSSKQIAGTIVELVEVTHVKQVAVASLDKKITLWDFDKGILSFIIDMGSGGIHNLVYSYQYQSLVTAGFENTLQIFRIDAQYIDFDAIGRLQGHNSMVTAVQHIEKSPMIISADDMGNIKIWDIRSFKCLQTINIGFRTTITQIIHIQDKNQVCLLGSRVNFMSFDTQVNQKSQEEHYPLKLEYNAIKQELLVCTRKDIRFMRMKDGKITKIYSGLLQNNRDDISTCSQVHSFNGFILGDQKGGLTLFSYNNGEILKTCQPHQSEVSQLRIDIQNKLLITSGGDSNIVIQQETNEGTETKRIIQNTHFKKDVTLMEVSVYHNIIITGSSERKLYVWDYEYCKLVACIELIKGVEPTGIYILNCYKMIIIATSSGMIHFIKFSIKEFKAKFELIFSFCVSDNDKNHSSDEEEEENDFQGIYDSQYSDRQINKPWKISKNTKSQTAIGQTSALQKKKTTQTQSSLQKGMVSQLAQQLVKFAENQEKKNIYHPLAFNEKQILQNNSIQSNGSLYLQNHSISSAKVNGPHSNEQLQSSQQYSGSHLRQNSRTPNQASCSHESSFEAGDEENKNEWVTKIMTEIEADEATGQLKKLSLFVSTNQGNVIIFQLDKLITKEELTVCEAAGKRLNYNPYRQCNEDFCSQIKQANIEKLNVDEILLNNKAKRIKPKLIPKLVNFQAHKEALTSFQFVELGKKFILTSSYDSFVRIWDLKGNLVGNVNINHPLPIFWKVSFDLHDKVKKQVFYALKILDIMFAKYKEDLQLRNLLQVDVFIKSLIPSNQGQLKLELKNVQSNHIKGLEQSIEGISFMKDEYSPRDMKFEESKKIYESELKGISLKQMEANKRLLLCQQQNESSLDAPPVDLHSKRKKQEDSEVINFLQEHWRDRVIHKNLDPEFNEGMYLLGRKLDQKIRDKNAVAKSRISMYFAGHPELLAQNEEQPSLYRRNSGERMTIVSNGQQNKSKDEQKKKFQKVQIQEPQEPLKRKGSIDLNDYKKYFEKSVDSQKLNQNDSKASLRKIQLGQNDDRESTPYSIKQNGGRNKIKTIDFLEYAAEKNYYIDEYQQLSTSRTQPTNQSVNNISKITNDITNISGLPNSSRLNNSQSMLQAEQPINILSQSQILMKLPPNASSKAKVSLALKTINAKLKKCKFQTESTPCIDAKNNNRRSSQIVKQPISDDPQREKNPQNLENFLQEALGNEQQKTQELIQKNQLQLLKQKSFLNHLKNDDLSRTGSQTDRKDRSPYKLDNEFKLPMISAQKIKVNKDLI